MLIHKSAYLEKFEKILDHAHDEFSILRTGRANVQLLDGVFIEAYGTKMSLREVAAVSAPDAQLLVIKPWDKSLMANIEKGIQLAQLNLNPVVDGDIIRIAVPSLTKERREEMVKIRHQKEEELRISMRNARADVRRGIEKQEGEAGVSEDDLESETTELDEVVKEYVGKLEEVSKKKEQELLNI
jgi:ribosome recycling factor